MNETTLQRIIDEFHATSDQQWRCRAIAIVSALGALFAVAAANERLWPAGVFIVTVLAVASAVRPDSHTSTVAIVVVMWHWLATVDSVSTPWLPVTAVCLLVHHAVITLSASLPIGGEVSRATIDRWALRTTLVGCGTVAMWAAVALLDTREASGNGLLTALALAIVAGAAVAIRSRSLDPN